MIHLDSETAVLRVSESATVEDAEPLLRELLARPDLRVDLRACSHVHAASLLVLMAMRPPLDPPPAGSGAQALLRAAGLAELPGLPITDDQDADEEKP